MRVCCRGRSSEGILQLTTNSPRVRKKRKTTATTQPLLPQDVPGPIGPAAEGRYEASPSQRSQQALTPRVSTSIDARNITTSPYYIPESAGRRTGPDDINQLRQDADQLPHDPGTGSSTYIGRSHYGDATVDETTARAYTLSRQTELSELEQKTLELWNVYALPPRAVHESLVEAFTESCLSLIHI